ncbi:MAG: hypothetical protein AAGI37_17905 [Planctomycetota bacterium]
MPAPSSSLASLRPDLAESLMEFDFASDQARYIGHLVFPVVPVQKQAGNFGKIPVEQLLKQASTARAPGSGYSRGNWTFEPGTYNCEEHGHEEVVDDREAEMYSDYFDAELVSAMRAQATVLRNYEQRVADAVFNTTTYTPTPVTNEWDDATNATPIEDVESRVQAIYDASGLWADTLIISQKVFRNLRSVNQIINRITASGAGNPAKAEDVTTAMLSAVFNLPKILVGGGTKNTANEGQTFAAAEIWSGEYASVCKTSDSQDFKDPCIGRTFHWAQDGSTPTAIVETYRDESVRGDVVRSRHDTDEVTLYSSAVALLSNITA